MLSDSLRAPIAEARAKCLARKSAKEAAIKIQTAQGQAELQATEAASNAENPSSHGVGETASPPMDEPGAVCMEDPYQQPEVMEGASEPAGGCGGDPHLAFDTMDEGDEDTKAGEAGSGSQEESGEEPKKPRGSYSTLESRYAVVQRFLVSYLSDE